MKHMKTIHNEKDCDIVIISKKGLMKVDKEYFLPGWNARAQVCDTIIDQDELEMMFNDITYNNGQDKCSKLIFN